MKPTNCKGNFVDGQLCPAECSRGAKNRYKKYQYRGSIYSSKAETGLV